MSENKKQIKLNSPAILNDGDVIVSVKDLEVQFSVRNRILTAIRKISLDIYKGEILDKDNKGGNSHVNAKKN